MIKSRLTVFVSCLFVFSFLLAPSPARTAKTQGGTTVRFVGSDNRLAFIYDENTGTPLHLKTPIESTGNTNVTGWAGGNFPTTPGAYQTTYSGLTFNESFETKLNSTGNALVYSAKGKLSLFVRDGITGYGVKSEIIFSSSKDNYLLSTNEGGILEFVGESGRFDLTINTPGYRQMNTFFYISPNEQLKTNIWMDRESNNDVTETENKSTAIIEGYVVDGSSGKPLEGVNVYFTAIDKQTKTNENGYFTIESEKVSKLEGDGDDNQFRVTIEFTKESFGDYAIKNFLLVKGAMTLRITLEKGKDKVVENYFQGILDKQNENTDTNEQHGNNQETKFHENEKNGTFLSPLSCPVLPTTIRVGTGCTSCSQVCTGTVQTMSLESYVQSGLDNEWFPSWLPASLQAGAVAYRTYGAYFVINQPNHNPNYDIRSDACNQAWVSGTASSCINAANATVGEVIVNSSNVIVKSEYSAENNDNNNPDSTCGNCFSGGNGWPCISDNVCCGTAFSGHGRGMCQWGSSRWATQGQTYTWILDHYYSPGNYFRCGSTGVTPPPNDNCSNAVLLTSNTACSFTPGTVLNATASGLSKPSCDNSSSPNMYDVWYKFTATSSSHMVTVDPSTTIGDPVVSVYSSCSGSPIGCSDVGEGVTENLQLPGLTVGNTYYVRIYDFGNVPPTGSNADFQICVTGTNVTPTITVSTTSLSSFGNVAVGQNSAPQSYSVSGSNLSANISIQAPTGFQISLSSTSGFTNTLTLTRSGGSVPTTTVFARFSPQASGAQTGNISHTSSGATTRNVSVSGTGTGGGTVQFSSATYSVNENGGSRTITLTRTGGTNAFVVNYGTSNGTATAGADYTGLNEVMSFATNETSKTFSIPIIDDTLVEGNETVNLNLSNPSGGVTLGSPSTAVLTIVDNDTVQNYMIAVSASPSAGGTVSGEGTFAAGSSRTVTATANTNYAFMNWTENNIVVSPLASYNFTLNGDRNLVANFTTIPQPLDSQFISQTVPTSVTPGQNFNVAMTWQNTGTLTWSGPAFYLVTQNPAFNSNWLGGPYNAIDLSPFTVPPGQQLTSSFTATAPTAPGTYNFQWQLYKDNGTGFFGQMSTNVAIVVSFGTGDTDGDGMPDAVELQEGTNPFVKDNDVFANARWFVMQQYRDFLGREGDTGGISFWTNLINSGSLTRAQVIDSFFNSTEFQGTVSPVTRLYFAYFLRIPDYAGLLFWVNQYRQGATLDNISQAFAQSPEFIARYGSLSNADFVTLLYNNVLGRQPDPGGLAFWVGQLNSGAMTRGQVMLGFSESTEYKQSSFNKVYVTMIYVGMLRRAPEQGGFDFWVNAMNGGASGLNLIQGFLNAPEYRNRFLP